MVDRYAKLLGFRTLRHAQVQHAQQSVPCLVVKQSAAICVLSVGLLFSRLVFMRCTFRNDEPQVSPLASSLLDFVGADMVTPFHNVMIGLRLRIIETKKEGTSPSCAPLSDEPSYVACCSCAFEDPILPTLDELRFLNCLEPKQHHSVKQIHCTKMSRFCLSGSALQASLSAVWLISCCSHVLQHK